LKKKTPEELERAKVAKVTRTLVRLKHSLAADEEINSLLPNTLDEFDVALANGELKHVGGAIDTILEG
jgi:hypothetical protein